MDVTPEDIDAAVQAFRRNRRLRKKEQRRVALAPYIDVGTLTDDEVQQVYDAVFNTPDPDPDNR